MKRKNMIVAALLLLVFLFAGCSAQKNATADYAAAPSSPRYEPETMPQESYDSSYSLTASGAGKTAESANTDAANQYGGHKVILTYDVTLEADAFDSLLTALNERLQEAGGYALNSYVYGKKPEVYGDSGRTATLVLRVPSEKAAQFFSDVKGMGTLQSEHTYAEDVTAEYFDRETRLSVLQIQLERLTNILVKTDNLADIITLESEIARVTIAIEELTGELRRYDALIDYATINVTVYETVYRNGPQAAKTVGERITEGFSDSLNSVSVFFVDLFVWLVSSAPVLLILLAVALVLFFILRAARRRRKAKRQPKPEENKLYEENK